MMQRTIAYTSMDICFLGQNNKEGKVNCVKVSYFTTLSSIEAVKDKNWRDHQGVEHTYTGEVDQKGKVCGHGVAIPVDKNLQEW